MVMEQHSLDIYSLVPGIDRFTLSPREYLTFMIEIARLSEEFGYTGSLLHVNHNTLSPWIITTTLFEHTSKLIPLLALQPASMPPFTAVKMIQSLAFLYQRRVALNMIAGASKGELDETCDTLEHDQRYERLSEYIAVMKLCFTQTSTTFQGKYYQLRELRFKPELPADLRPEFFVAGSSPGGFKVALEHAHVVVTHPQPVDLFRQGLPEQLTTSQVKSGIRIGLICRPQAFAAWNIARERFPKSRLGAVRTMMQRKSESVWIQDLARLATENEIHDEVFWMGAYHSGQANCPYLVGDYEQVAQYLARYLDAGVQTILVDGPLSREEFEHTREVFLHLARLRSEWKNTLS